MQCFPSILMVIPALLADAPHLVHWIGHFHPAMTVFPIAMLLSAALAELLRVMGGGTWLDGASRWCVMVGAIGGLITAPLGWAFALDHGESRWLEIHRWLGTAAGAGALVLLILSEVARRKGGGTLTLFRIVLFLAVPLVVATGFFGGAMVYGVHEYDWNAPAHEDEAEDRAAPATEPTTKISRVFAAVPEVVMMTDDDTFQPATLTVKVGEVVRWRNGSKDTHTVTADPKMAADAKDVSLPATATPFDSGEVKPGQSFEHAFTVPGTYKYVCRPHEAMDMKGQVIVQPAGKD